MNPLKFFMAYLLEIKISETDRDGLVADKGFLFHTKEEAIYMESELNRIAAEMSRSRRAHTDNTMRFYDVLIQIIDAKKKIVSSNEDSQLLESIRRKSRTIGRQLSAYFPAVDFWQIDSVYDITDEDVRYAVNFVTLAIYRRGLRMSDSVVKLASIDKQLYISADYEIFAMGDIGTGMVKIFDSALAINKQLVHDNAIYEKKVKKGDK